MCLTMCAITGIVDLEVSDTVIEKMLETMRRRGPDGQGIYQKSACTLLHTRLAIVDPAGGSQPMILDWAGERYILTYNGELYNTGELRKELSAIGHSFQGYSDTEVVIHSYAQWGEKCIYRFNGIFAFGI